MLTRVKENWFYVLLPFLMLGAWLMASTPESLADPVMTERVLLFDALISLPLLYFLFLRSRASLRVTLLRVAALAGSGVWFASWLMPEGSGQILPWLSWLRYVALPVLIGIELIALVAVVRHVYGDTPDEAHLIALGMPPIIAKAMLAEARFWKRVFAWLRR